MSLAELFYLKETFRERLRRWRHTCFRHRARRSALSARHFFFEPLEPRLLLSATPIEVVASQQLEAAAVTVPAGSLPSLDVDLNGQADALSDGIVIIRHLFGFTGNALVDGAVDPAGQRTDPTEIENYLNSIGGALDVDLNQQADALSDGITIIRSLFGFTGPALTNGVVDPAGQRTDPAVIAAFLDNMNPARELVAPLFTADLQQDTGLNATDAITFNPTITGTLTDINQIALFTAGFDATPVGSFVNVLADLQATGNFTLSTARMNQLAGGTLADGAHTLHLRATDARGNVATLDRAFTLDTLAPLDPTFDLALTSDTGTLGDQQTTAGIVTLKGLTDPTTSLQLIGPGTATLSTGTGTFQLPDLALAVGSNAFIIRATDVAGNQSDFSRTITRLAATAQADVVLTWNQTMLDAIRLDATPPPLASRGMAMVSLAMYDTINAIEGIPGYYVSLPAQSGTSADAAAASAAHRVLSYLYPGQQAFFDTQLAASLASIPNGPAKTNGITLGQNIADAIIAIRATDGWNDFVDYVPGAQPGAWQQTAPMYDVALSPQWADLTPFALTSPDQFRPAGPPALDSAAYAAALNEVKALGSAISSTRTADQTQIARFWADGGGTYTPPGHWDQIAQQIALQQGNSLSANARLFAELNVALADAGITAWNTKYADSFWRPVTAIQQAGLDANALTIADPAWSSLLITPPFPEYISGHSTFSGAAAEILTSLFGSNVGFTTTSLGLPGVTRTFTSFEQAAQEAGRSRIYGGIHFEFSNQDGLTAGHQLADFVLNRFTVTTDTQGPKVLLNQTSGTVTKTNLTLTGQVLDNLAGVAALQAKVDNGAFASVAFSPAGTFSLPTTLVLDGTADGTHTVTFQATDNVGNVSTVLFNITLDTTAPTITLTAPIANEGLTVASRLTGSVSGTGSAITKLTYAFDGGTAMPITIDPVSGVVDEQLDLSKLNTGNHTLTVTAMDAAGNSATTNVAVSLAALIPLTITAITPQTGSSDVGSTFRPQVFFSRSINPTTLNANNFYATDSTGTKLAATIVPSQDGTFAWLFFTNPMPGGETITVHVDGATILGAVDGQALDADSNGTPGGLFTSTFSTVSLIPIPGTTITGRVFDPGADLKPMTFDDIRAGADGILHTPDDVFLNPIANAKVFIVGLESQAVFTDAQGNFTLTNVPGGNVKVAVDGRTATNVPIGVFFPEMVMDSTIEPGLPNTLMGSMGTAAEQRANETRGEVYLPRLQQTILQAVSGTGNTTIGVDATAAPNLTQVQREQLQLIVQPGTLVDANGNPVANAQVGISTVPPELVRDMLPPGVLQHTFDITIQAPGVAAFTTPLQITFPNVFNAAPGTQLNFLSFDHTTGRLVIEGTATVSADGLSVTTDPGQGITKPGWHGLIGQAVDALTSFIATTAESLANCLNADDILTADRLWGNLKDVWETGKDLYDLAKAGAPYVAALIGGIGGSVAGPAGAAAGAAFFYGAGLIGTSLLNTGEALIGESVDMFERMVQEGIDRRNDPLFNSQIFGGWSYVWDGIKQEYHDTLPKFDEISRDGIRRIIPGEAEILNFRDAAAKWPEVKEDFAKLLAHCGSPGGAAFAISQAAVQATDPLSQFYAHSWLTGSLPQLLPPTNDLNVNLNKLAAAEGWGAPSAATSEAFAEIYRIVNDPNSGLLPADRDLLAIGASVNEISRLVADGTDTESAFVALQAHVNFVIGNVRALTDYANRRQADLRELATIYTNLFRSVADEVGVGALKATAANPLFYTYNIGGTRIAGKAVSAESVRVSLPVNSVATLVVYDPVGNMMGVTPIATPSMSGGIFRPEVLMRPASGPDTDGDGIPDIAEAAVGTVPSKADSDGDGILDRAELLAGTDPLGGRGLPSGVVSSVALQGEAKGIFITGSTSSSEDQTAYVATGSYGLAITDASQFRTPLVLGQLDLPGDAVDVSVDSSLGIAAVASGAGGLHFVNVTTPNVPALLQTIAINASQVEVFEGVVYVATGSEVRAYDLLTGEKLAAFSGGSTITGLAREGRMLYTVDAGRTLRAIDIGSGVLVGRGTFVMPSAGSKLFVGGGVAYVAAGNGGTGGFMTANVANPDLLQLLSGIDSNGVAGTAIALNGSGLAVVAGSSSFVIGGFKSVDVINVSDPTNTGNFITRLNLPQVPFDVAIGAGIAFVADGTGDLQVVSYLSFDNQGVAPTVTATLDAVDLDPLTPGIQVLEGSLVRLRPTVTDDVQVRNVELLQGGQVVQNDVAFPFEMSAALPTIAANGSNLVTLQVRATDTGGNVGLSAPITVQLVPDTFGPTLVSSTVNEGGIFGRSFRSVTLTFSEAIDPASFTTTAVQLVDSNGIAKSAENIQFRADGKQVQLTFVQQPVGAYRLRIDRTQVKDRVGNTMGTGFSDTHFTINQFSIEWIAPTGGNWNTAANWSTGVLPTATDDVFIGVTSSPVVISSGTVTLQSLISNSALTLSAGTITLNGDSQINGVFVQSGGIVGGAGKMILNGPATITGGTMRDAGTTVLNGATTISGSGLVLDGGRVLTNANTVTWTAGTIELNNNVQAGAGTINNLVGATWLDSGTVAKTMRATFGTAGDNALALFNNAGTYTKSGTGTSFIGANLTDTGTLTVTSGILDFYALTNTHSAASTLTVGAGATLNNSNSTQVLTGGTVNVAGTLSMNDSFAVLNLAAAQVLNGTGTLLLANGTLTGTSTLTVNLTTSITFVSMRDAGTTVLNGATTISGSGLVLDGGRVLTNANTVTWTAGTIELNNNVQAGAGTINNLVGATWLDSGTVAKTMRATFGTAGDNALALFNNAGTYTKSGTGTTAIGANFLDSNVLTVTSGILDFYALTNTHSAASTLTVGAGATLNNSNSTQVLTGGTVNVAGTLSMNGSFSELNLAAAQVLNGTGTLLLANGVLTGTSTLTVNLTTSITFVSMRDAGTTVLNGATTISGSGLVLDGGRVLTNSNTVTWTAGTIELNNNGQAGAGTINNLVGATWLDSGTVAKTMRSAFGTAADNALALFNNAGTYTKSGTGTTTLAAQVLQAGTVLVQTGTIQFTGATVLTNAGTISVKAGALTSVTGGYSQTAAGSLGIEVGGLLTSQFGRLTVTGAATLDGALNISLANGFIPVLGNRFRFMTEASRTGFFATTNGLDLGGGLAFQVDQTAPLSLDLVTVTAAPASATVQDSSPVPDLSLAYVQQSWVKDFVNGSTASIADRDQDEELVIALPV